MYYHKQIQMKRYIAFLVLAFFASLTCINALAQKQIPPQGISPRDFVLPAKKQSSLSNGMRVVKIQYGAIPKVHITLAIKTGGIHESGRQVWLSHLLASMMNEGSVYMNASTLAKKVASMGGEISVNAGEDQFFVIGSALSEYAPELIRLIAELTISPAMPAKELNRLKTDLKRRLALSKTVPQSLANEKFNQLIYGNTAYGTSFPTEAMLDGYTLEDVRNFYHDNMGAKRAVLYVAGKFDEAAVSKSANTYFSKWGPGAAPFYPATQYANSPGSTIINREGALQTTIIMGLPVINPKSSDYLPLTVMNNLLGGSFASRITSNIREDKGYTYSPFSGFSIHPNAATWSEEADVSSEHTLDAIKEIKKEILRLQKENPTDQELIGIQRYMAGIFVLQNSSPKGIISQLNFLDLYQLDDSNLTNRVKNIYSVTPKQISLMTQKYLPVDKMTIVMVGDEKAIKQQQQAAEK